MKAWDITGRRGFEQMAKEPEVTGDTSGAGGRATGEGERLPASKELWML